MLLHHLVQKFKENETKINDWFLSLDEKLGTDPVYASVDLRNAGYKIAPVDTNIFPAGFNNLCPSYRREAGRLFKQYMRNYYPDVKKIALLAEEHTRNLYYFENLFMLTSLLREVGFEVEIASLSAELSQEKNVFETSEKNTITVWKAHVSGSFFEMEGFKPDLILVNNDFSAGIPELIKKIVQPMIPTPKVGWHIRKKSDHFECYQTLSHTLAKLIDIDPWLIFAPFGSQQEVDFGDEKSTTRLAQKVDLVMNDIRPKFKEYNIKGEPFVFVKNDAGTYGMAVMTATSGDELLNLNKKERNKMKVGKNLRKVTEVIIQEGIPTTDRVHGNVAEPVLYLVNHRVCGGFFRINENKDDRSNLNQPGMKFTKLCFHEMLGYTNEYPGDLCDPECFQIVYKNIARLASYAAGCEIKQLQS